MNLFALVKASPACTALLGTDPVRFFEFGQAPQLETLPYVTHQFVTGTPYNALDGGAAADHITVQVDVWAESSAQCKAIADTVRAAVENACHVTAWLGTNREEDLFRTTFTLQFITIRT